MVYSFELLWSGGAEYRFEGVRAGGSSKWPKISDRLYAILTVDNYSMHEICPPQSRQSLITQIGAMHLFSMKTLSAWLHRDLRFYDY